MTSPTLPPARTRVTSMIGSSSTGPASSIAWRMAIEPAILNAISDESTVW